jgi:hypothetical protein
MLWLFAFVINAVIQLHLLICPMVNMFRRKCGDMAATHRRCHRPFAWVLPRGQDLVFWLA